MLSSSRSALRRVAAGWRQLVPVSFAALSVNLSSGDETVDRFENLARATPAAMAGHAVNTTIALLALLGPVAPLQICAWALCSYAICGYVLYRRLRAPGSGSSPTAAASHRMERRAQALALLLALPWAVLGVCYLGTLPSFAETIVISLGVGMAASGAVLLAPVKRAAILYMSTILAPTASTCFTVLPVAEYGHLGALAVSYWLFLLALITTSNRLFAHRQQTVQRLRTALAETDAARQENERIAMLDPLTGLANRRSFLQRLGLALGAAAGQSRLAVLFLDLDRFKSLNDSFGHRFGDMLLEQVAVRLSGSVSPDALVARLGGDEFAIICTGVASEEQARVIAGALVGNFAVPFVVQEHTVTIGISVGVTLVRPGDASTEQVVKRADIAMYEAKASGRNGFVVFKTDMQQRLDVRRTMEFGLRRALATGEFALYFQPIYDLGTLQVSSFEALIRWRHPERGLIGPAEFLPVAEDMGLITDIGRWMLREACRAAQSWPGDLGLAVNLSAIQMEQPQIVQDVEGILRETGLAPRRLELEITETVLLRDCDDIARRLDELKAMGIRLGMDDFGTGYSSLSYLASFPLDGLKIDKSFITRYEAQGTAEIMRAMVALARALNRSCTIEGIETLQQLLVAQTLGAAYGQGYFLGVPCPAESVGNYFSGEERQRLPGTEIRSCAG